jgi:hypothetical protein
MAQDLGSRGTHFNIILYDYIRIMGRKKLHTMKPRNFATK